MEINWISYDTNVEVFIALRDVNLYYSPKDQGSSRRVSVRHVAFTMAAYWKPPGALQWIEKCVTETVFKDRSPSFAVKMHIQCERKDVHAIDLRFELRDKSFGMEVIDKFTNTLGYVETTLSNLLELKSKGQLLQLPYYTYTTCNTLLNDSSELHQISPGQCFLRAEILKPCDESVLLQFALLLKKQAKCRKVYCLEIHKLNEEGLFQLQQPYTLVHRSEILRDPAKCAFWHHINIPLSRLCNGDLERVLKLVVYDPDKTPSIGGYYGTGFALTTLRRLLTNGERRLPLIQTKDGKISEKGCLFINQYSKLHHPSVEYYLKKGLAIRPIYAVDFSLSNWNIQLHKRNLHGFNEGISPYEEALEITMNAMEGITEGDSVFYSFGGQHVKPYVSTFSDCKPLESLMNNYSVALCSAKMEMQDLEDDPKISPKCYPIRPNNSISTHLTPLLIDLLALIGIRKDTFEYFTVFIFTDGEFTDLESSMHKLIEVAKLPVSIIFIAVGQGNLRKLLLLQKEWKHPTTRQTPCRNISTVIHFRSLLDWNSSIKFAGHFTSNPQVLFCKEIMNSVERQLGKYMRIMHPYC